MDTFIEDTIKEFDEKFYTLVFGNGLQLGDIAKYEAVKKFLISKLEAAIRDHDAKWHPIEDNKMLTHLEAYKARIREGVVGMKNPHDSIADSFDNLRHEGFEEARNNFLTLLDGEKYI